MLMSVCLCVGKRKRLQERFFCLRLCKSHQTNTHPRPKICGHLIIMPTCESFSGRPIRTMCINGPALFWFQSFCQLLEPVCGDLLPLSHNSVTGVQALTSGEACVRRDGFQKFVKKTKQNTHAKKSTRIRYPISCAPHRVTGKERSAVFTYELALK